MRYIANSKGYIKEISFGAIVECEGATCTEYTGAVPGGYESIEDWFNKECESLYRWMIVNGNLTMDPNAKEPDESKPQFGVELLWENKKLTDNFQAQTIALALSGYDSVYVEAIRSTDDNKISGRTNVQVGGLPGYLMGTTNQFALTRREVSATKTGVTFSGFYSANTSNGASNEIPYRIYGIKGISE